MEIVSSVWGEILTLSGANSDDGNSYLWNSDNFSTTTFEVENEGLITLTITDQHDCTNSDSIYIKDKVCQEVFIPNAVNLSKNSTNPYFNVISPISTGTLRIYDRYGKLLYHTNDINAPWSCIYNGQRINRGVYNYQLTLSESDIYVGNFTVIN